jgi:signal transduction histidine kinase
MNDMRDDALIERLSGLNSELTNLQRELIKTNVELQQANQRKNQVLGMAAHDLRNPLAVILTYSAFLAKHASRNLDSAQLDFVAVIKESSEFMLRLVNDLLDLSAIEAGELKLIKSAVDLASIVVDNVRRNSVLVTKRRINIALQGLPIALRCACDRYKIEQVLDNLLGNAFKFAPDGSEISVRMRREHEFAEVSVQDQGPGIAPDLIPRLFEPFCSVSQPREEREQSTGLGLAIARRIVEGHGGHIWADSRPGRGARFTFTVPLLSTGAE